MSYKNIVIFGQGKVGVATDLILKTQADFHDPNKGITITDFNDYDLAVICVSSLIDDANDHQSLNDCLTLLSHCDFSGLVAVRCTVSPVYMINAIDKFANLKIIHFPEFMRQRDNDYLDCPWITVLGGDRQYTEPFGHWLVQQGYGTTDMLHHVSVVESSLIKLYQNAGLALKVVYANVMYESCEKFGADYEKVRTGVGADVRIGHGHLQVPGDDGYGFSGHCLPKDVNCLNSLMSHRGFWDMVLGINSQLLERNLQ